MVNQNWEQAVFQDLGSCPATMDAARAADCVGCFPGNDCQIADAVQAYIQAKLKGDACWVSLPPEARPKNRKWANMKKPVVRLRKALYGHPDSGSFWEQHCDKHVRSVGFEPVGAEWPSVYTNPKLKLFSSCTSTTSSWRGPNMR